MTAFSLILTKKYITLVYVGFCGCYDGKMTFDGDLYSCSIIRAKNCKKKPMFAPREKHWITKIIH